MWIEKLEFAEKGNSNKQHIKFVQDKLNIVVENNQGKRVSILEALWALIYGYSDNQADDVFTSPFSKTISHGYIDLEIGLRMLRLTRDFKENTFRVLDLSDPSAYRDITYEFRKSSAEDVGLSITGLNRDVFRRLCLAGQNGADSKSTCFSALSMTACLEKVLAEFPYKGKVYKLDSLIAGLEQGKDMLSERLKILECERLSINGDLGRLFNLKKQFQEISKKEDVYTYFQLCLDVAKLDDCLIKIKEQLKATPARKGYLPEVLKEVKALWHLRQEKLEAYRCLDLEAKAISLDRNFRQLNNQELSAFELDDAKALTSLANSLKIALLQLDEAKNMHQQERHNMRESSLGFSCINTNQLQKSLPGLETQDLENVYAYQDMIIATKDVIAKREQSALRQRAKLKEIDEQRAQMLVLIKKMLVIVQAVCILLGLALFLLSWFFHKSLTDPLLFMLFAFLVFILAFSSFMVYMLFYTRRTYRIADQLTAMQAEQEEIAEGQKLHSKVASLEARIEALAHKAGLDSGNKLLTYLQDFATAFTQLKDLSLLEQRILTAEAEIEKLSIKLRSALDKAGRNSLPILPETALALSQEIEAYCKVDFQMQQLATLATEICNCETRLYDYFCQAKLQDPSDIDKSYDELLRIALSGEEEINSLNIDLPVTYRTLIAHVKDPRHALKLLQAQSSRIWTTMQQLVVNNPEIANSNPLEEGNARGDLNGEILTLQSCLKQIRQEQSDLTNKVRLATKNYEQYFLKTHVELRVLEHELSQLCHAKAAILLAHRTMQNIAKTRSILSGKELAENLLAPLPFILDKSLSIPSDDELLKMVRFLLKNKLHEHQLMLFGCGQQQYEWLMNQLEDSEKQLIHVA